MEVMLRAACGESAPTSSPARALALALALVLALSLAQTPPLALALALAHSTPRVVTAPLRCGDHTHERLSFKKGVAAIQRAVLRPVGQRAAGAKQKRKQKRKRAA